MDNLDYSKVYDNIINGIKKYVERNAIKTLVLGISGGIDSTVTAALCNQVDIPLIGISLPCSTNKLDERSAANLVGQEFCTSFKELNLQKPFEVVESFCKVSSDLDTTPISQGNIKARLRMITLYDVASKTGGIVVDTDNLTEHFLGFWTIHGDDGDFNPIGGLRKHEVYGLAKWMKENVYEKSKALEASISLIPTDGNGVSGSDMDQIAPGKTYDDVDEILQTWISLDKEVRESIKVNKIFDDEALLILGEKHGKDVVERVILRSIKSDFKRRHHPLIIDVNNGEVLDKGGNVV